MSAAKTRAEATDLVAFRPCCRLVAKLQKNILSYSELAPGAQLHGTQSHRAQDFVLRQTSNFDPIRAEPQNCPYTLKQGLLLPAMHKQHHCGALGAWFCLGRTANAANESCMLRLRLVR